MRRVLLGMVLTLTAACADQEAGRGETVNGTYTLRSVNDAPLPFVISGSGNDKTELLDESYSLYEGFTYAGVKHVRTTVNGTATVAAVSEAGQYQILLGNSLSINPNGGTARLTVYSTNTLTISEPSKVSVYRK